MNLEIQTTIPFVDIAASKELVGIDQLVVDAYESAPSEQKIEIVAQLVGKVYKDAPPEMRGCLLEHLLKPLGVLALLTVANGVFSKIRFRTGWAARPVQLEDTRRVQASDVTELVDYIQHASIQVVDSLIQLLANPPTLAGSAAAVVLVSLLMKRAHFRRIDDVPFGATWKHNV